MEQWEFSVTAGENVPVTATLKESLAVYYKSKGTGGGTCKEHVKVPVKVL